MRKVSASLPLWYCANPQCAAKQESESGYFEAGKLYCAPCAGKVLREREINGIRIDETGMRYAIPIVREKVRRVKNVLDLLP